MSAADFDWYRDEDVVIPVQEAIAVYRNVRGNVVIRQRGNWHDHEDDLIIEVAPDRAAAVAQAILVLAEPMPEQTLALPAPADRTAADRQRRHRERKRNGPCDRDVVTRNGSTTSADLFKPA